MRKIIAAIIFFSFSISGFSQEQKPIPDINGKWEGSYFWPQLNDWVTIELTIKTEGSKISGSTKLTYSNGKGYEKLFSGKIYKKNDGFYVEEEKIDKKKVMGTTPTIFLERYNFDFKECKSNELNGDIECLRSVFVTTWGCHDKLQIRLVKK